jgi:hypothetical protein
VAGGRAQGVGRGVSQTPDRSEGENVDTALLQPYYSQERRKRLTKNAQETKDDDYFEVCAASARP